MNKINMVRMTTWLDHVCIYWVEVFRHMCKLNNISENSSIISSYGKRIKLCADIFGLLDTNRFEIISGQAI